MKIMDISYDSAKPEDIECIFQLNVHLIREYENVESIDYNKVLDWTNNKIENCIHEYTVIYADGKKAGYYHFYKNEDAEFEIDDLYIFSEFQGKGIGSIVIRRCCSLVNEPIMLYVFIKNQRAISLYRKLGFEVVETVRDSRFIMKRDGNRKYYNAYDERYKAAHMHGISWSSDISSPIVMDVIQKYHICRNHRLLEIGCGEGRDSRTVLEHGY